MVAAAAVFATAPNALAATTGLDPVRVSGATDAGALSRSAVPVTIVLAPRDKAGLDRAAKAGGGLTPVQFNTRFAPSATTVQAVRTWAAASGLTVSSVSANRLLVRVSGSAAACRQRSGPPCTASAPRAAALLRAGHAERRCPRRSPARRPRCSGSPTSAAWAPPDKRRIPRDYRRPTGRRMWSLYDAPSGATGAGQTRRGDRRGRPHAAARRTSSPSRTPVRAAARGVEPDRSRHAVDRHRPASDEWDLDTQYSTGLAPDVTTCDLYVGASLSNDDILATINRWVTDDASSQASFSAGECEVLAFATGFTTPLDTVLAAGRRAGPDAVHLERRHRLVLPGRGRRQRRARRPARAPTTRRPARSRSASAAPRCSAPARPRSPGTRAAAAELRRGRPRPTRRTPAAASSACNRGVPDVALDADPNSGYDVIVDGQEEIDRRHERERSVLAGHLGARPGRPRRHARLRRPRRSTTRARVGVQRHHPRHQRAFADDARLGLHDRPRHAGHHGVRGQPVIRLRAVLRGGPRRPPPGRAAPRSAGPRGTRRRCSVCSTSAAERGRDRGAGDARGVRRAAAVRAAGTNSSTNAAASSQVGHQPRIPCSAATVSGIVCETAATRGASGVLALAVALGERARAEAPRPAGRAPSAGRPRIRSPRPLVALLSALAELRVEVERAAERDARPRARRRRRRATPRRAPAAAPAQRGQHGQPDQQRGEARLREREHQARPQHRQRDRDQRRRRAGGASTAARAASSDHRQRQVAPVDVRVEEQRVDPEVRLELVGRQDLALEISRRPVAYSTNPTAANSSASPTISPEARAAAAASSAPRRSSRNSTANGT